MRDDHRSSKDAAAKGKTNVQPTAEPDVGLCGGVGGTIQQTDEVGNPEDRSPEAEQYDESYSHPRQPQGEDAKVDEREQGRGNQYGKAGEYGKQHEKSDTRPPDPDKQPGRQ